VPITPAGTLIFVCVSTIVFWLVSRPLAAASTGVHAPVPQSNPAGRYIHGKAPWQRQANDGKQDASTRRRRHTQPPLASIAAYGLLAGGQELADRGRARDRAERHAAAPRPGRVDSAGR
jgi:hypothetical protein